MVFLKECCKAFHDSDFFQYTIRTIMYPIDYFNV